MRGSCVEEGRKEGRKEEEEEEEEEKNGPLIRLALQGHPY